MKTIEVTHHWIRGRTRLAEVLAAALTVSSLVAQVPFTEVDDTGDLWAIITANDVASWGDFDGDGDVDLFIGQVLQQGNLVLQNDGTGKFTRMTETEIGELANDTSDPGMALWADLDNDGDLDLYLANYSEAQREDDWYTVGTLPQADRLYLNDGSGRFSLRAMPGLSELSSYSISANLVDYDADGWLDVFVATYPINSGFAGADRLFHNQGDLSFSPVILPESSTGAWSSSWVDYDGDGDLDVLVNDSKRGHRPQIYRNRRAETGVAQFTASSTFLNGQTLGNRAAHSAWGDFDNDGDLDLYIENGFSGDATGGGADLWTNLGGGAFERRDFFSDSDQGSGWAAWIDHDNDGDLDLLTVVRDNDGRLGTLLYEGDGTGGFVALEFQQIPADGSHDDPGPLADVNNDGFMDILVLDGSVESQSNAGLGDRLFRNDGNANHWLKVVPEGTDSNRSAIGAIVRVKATINGKETWQMRQIMAGDGSPFIQHDIRPNFGLGDATVAEIVRIEWPSGNVQNLRNVPVDQILAVTETPALTLTVDLEASWSSRAEGYTLVSAPTPLGPWTPVNAQVTTENGRNATALVPEGEMRFYRLEKN